MPGTLEGKVAVITGAGRGIGRGIAILMAEEGAKVVVNDAGVNPDGSGHLPFILSLSKDPADQVASFPISHFPPPEAPHEHPRR